MKRDRFCFLKLGIQQNNSGSTAWTSFRVIQVPAITCPIRLHPIPGTFGKNFGLSFSKAVFANLKSTTHRSGKCDPGRILRVPAGFCTMRTNISWNPGKPTGGKRELIELWTTSAVWGDNQSSAVRRPARTRFIASIVGYFSWLTQHAFRQPNFRISWSRKNKCHLGSSGVL